MINLKPFCGDDDPRDYLNAPFSEGTFTYATNGHILIRVARRDDVPEVDDKSSMKGKCEKLFADNPFVAAVPIPEVPPLVEEDCDCCNGEGTHERKCGKSSDYPCAECNATGSVMVEPDESKWPRIEVGNAGFDPRYLRLLLTLPNVQLSPNAMEPAPFTFDGGSGLIMPMRE